MIWFLGLLVIAAAVYGVVRQLDVRLVLTLAGLALASLAGEPMAVVRMFLATLTNERFVVPICSAMGFAYVLRLTACDQHLVHLLVRPLQYVRLLVVPGAVLVGFLVNIPVISQTSTAVAIGSVLVPLLRASQVSAATTGAALLLGSSLGGELVNPGAPELNSVANALGIKSADCVQRVFPLLMIQLGVATTLFWLLSIRAEAAQVKENKPTEPAEADSAEEPPFRVNIFKALVPLVPITLLFLTGPPLNVWTIPREWLVDDAQATGPADVFESRKIGAAMLVGVVIAALSAPRKVRDTAGAFFEGAGYAFARIIGIIVAATCFGEGVKRVGLAALIGRVTDVTPYLLLPTAGVLPLAFAVVSGSGMASTQALFEFFVEPARQAGIDPLRVGALVPIAAAAGRTMSPVAAVTLMAAALTDTSPLLLARRVVGPLLIGMVVVVIAAMHWV